MKVIAGDALGTGEHKVEITRNGKGPLYTNAYLTVLATSMRAFRTAGARLRNIPVSSPIGSSLPGPVATGYAFPSLASFSGAMSVTPAPNSATDADAS